MKSKNKLYIGDSSDEEDIVYSKRKIIENTNKLNKGNLQPTNFLSSFILEEVSHSILENRSVLNTYSKKKNKISLNNNDVLLINDRFLFGKHLINKSINSSYTEWLKKFYNENTQNMVLSHL